eukprot:CAMPEP_0197034652 /NCGR_PEP_ID=MMETSP1384-20130603/12694_1 /TAXON_ID=29189 /ORGANISM="Ammonia sp." /LENGTH=644 /DNA_ID=CAMNT_0042464603 /DNA_START=91 /DNA_END=2025 /DNA_ORIENTATION=+
MADTESKTEANAEPVSADKEDDKELLALDDDDAQNDTKSVATEDATSVKPEDDDDEEHIIEVHVRPRTKDEAESDLSSSDDEDELISNTEDWDITFKLAQFLDNHFIFPLVNHLKNQKKLLQKAQKEEKQQEQDNPDELKATKPEHAKISLVAEKLVQLYDDEDLNKLQFELLSKTCLIDEQMELFDVLQDTKLDKSAALKQGLSEYKQRIVGKLQELEEVCGPLIDFLGDEKSVNDLVREKSFSLESIQEKNSEIVLDKFHIDHLFAYCRLRYEIGYYQNTDVLLGYYRMLTPDLQKKNAALWGQLSAQILQNKWDDAFRAIRDIREHIEDNLRTLNLNKGEEAGVEEEEDYITKRLRELEEEAAAKERGSDADDDEKEEEKEKGKAEEESKKAAEENEKKEKQALHIGSIMRDRAWLLHWSLFVFFNKDLLLDELIALFLNNKYMNVIQSMCPHLLRYLTSAILISPNIDKQSKLKYLTDVSKIIIEEHQSYCDPITEFVRLVIRTNDFEGASKMLQSAMDVVRCDFFLAYYQDYFVQYARTTFLIKYCRLYNRISVQNISRLLLMDGMTNDEQQLWLINAIRSENINAKLDVLENVIYVHFNETNPYQEMKDRTKSMNQRTIQLYQQIRHKEEAMAESQAN